MKKNIEKTLCCFIIAVHCLISGATFTLEPLEPSQNLVDQLREASPGDLVDVDFSPVPSNRLLNYSPDQLDDAGGSLIYSDNPETALECGILYQDTLPAGDQRLYIYHVNGTSQSAKITAVLENAGAGKANVGYTRKALPSPSGNYIQIGRQGVKQFYENSIFPSDLILETGEKALLDPELDNLAVTKNQLVGGIYEYHSDQDMKVTIAMLPRETDTLSVIDTLEFAENDGYQRQGTFSDYSRLNAEDYVYNTSHGIKAFRVAAPSGHWYTDPPMEGVDAETGEASILLGNYGVTYRIATDAAFDDHRSLALLVNPRGGYYGGYFRTSVNRGVFQGRMVPEVQATIPDHNRAGVIDVIPPASENQRIVIEFIPAGASPLPFDIWLVPFSEEVKETGWMLY